MKNLILILALQLSSIVFAQEFKTFTCISGDCKNGFGTKNYDIGHSYTGQFKNGRFHGEGTDIYDGITYKGQFKNGFKDGEGKMIKKDGTIYTGQWKNGSEDGEGTLTKKDGTTYKGQWKKRLRQGEGTETTSDGIIRSGNWDHDDLEGKGKETLPNGYYMTAKFLYIGQKNTKCYDNNNNEISWTKYDELKNQFSIKENLRKTAEAIEAATPKCITGDCKNGYGVMRYQDGTKYFGMWQNETYYGLGYVVEPDVTTYKYDDKDGRDPYGGLYSLKQVPVVTPGKVSYGDWKNGVRISFYDNVNDFTNAVCSQLPSYCGQFNEGGLYGIYKAKADAEAKQQKDEEDAAERAHYNKQIENVNMTPSSSSSNETTVKTTTVTKSGNEIIDFKTVPKQ